MKPWTIESATAYIKRIERLIRPEGRGASYVQLFKLKDARRFLAQAKEAA